MFKVNNKNTRTTPLIEHRARDLFVIISFSINLRAKPTWQKEF